MLKRVDFSIWLYVILVYLELATAQQKIYNVTWNSKYYIGIIITVFSFALCFVSKKRGNISRTIISLAVMSLLPVLVAYIYSMVLTIFIPTGMQGFYSRSVGMLAYSVLAIVQAFFVYNAFGDRVVYYTFIAIAMSYFTSMVVAFMSGGIAPFISIVTDSSFLGSVLEMHELAPITSLFVFYFYYQYKFNGLRKETLKLCLFICGIILLFSMKRIVILSTAVSIILFWMIVQVNKRRPRQTLLFLNFVSVMFIIASLLFVYSIKSGLLVDMLARFHINTMARNVLWSAPKKEYEFSLFYFGRGLGFLSKWMDNNWMHLGINGLTQTIGIHSDILKYYIDLGFWGFSLYFGAYLIVITKIIYQKAKGTEYVLYYIVMFMQFLIFFTDNVSIYHNYQWITFLIMFSLISKHIKQVSANVK